LHHISPDLVEFDPDEIAIIRRIVYTRWMEGAISYAEWDKMSYQDQCMVMEVKRAFDENTKFDRNVKR
jgi:hypothetical protein